MSKEKIVEFDSYWLNIDINAPVNPQLYSKKFTKEDLVRKMNPDKETKKWAEKYKGLPKR